MLIEAANEQQDSQQAETNTSSPLQPSPPSPFQQPSPPSPFSQPSPPSPFHQPSPRPNIPGPAPPPRAPSHSLRPQDSASPPFVRLPSAPMPRSSSSPIASPSLSDFRQDDSVPRPSPLRRVSAPQPDPETAASLAQCPGLTPTGSRQNSGSDMQVDEPAEKPAEKIVPKHGFNMLAGFTPVARNNEAMPPCACGCANFEADLFKPSKCTQCFHVHSPSLPLSRQSSPMAVSKGEAPPACKSCNCGDFKADAFKPAKCSNCFHVHA